MSRLNSFRELEHLGERLQREAKKFSHTMIVCDGPGCQATGSLPVLKALRQELARQGLDKTVRVRVTGCHGFCEQGPIMVIEPGNVFYCRVAAGDAEEIVSRTVARDEIVERLLYTGPVTGEKVRTEAAVPFYRAQDRQVLSRNRMVDPNSIKDYIAAGGYSSLALVLDRVR